MTLLAIWFITCNLTCTLGSCTSATTAGMNLLGLSAVIFLSLRAVMTLTRADQRLLFSPLVAYAASTALFFGLGPMSTFLASEATLGFQANSLYALDGAEMLRTNLLTTAGVAISLFAMQQCLPRGLRAVKNRPVVTIRTVALVFLVTGLVLKHLLIMPSIYGTTNIAVPGMLRNLRYLPDLGFALAAAIAASGDRRWQILFWALWPWHLLLAFPEFSKKSVMMTILLPALGAYIGHRSFKRLMVWILAAMVLFTSLQNVNAISRWGLIEAEEYHEVLGVRERFELLLEAGFSEHGVETYLPAAKIGVQSWWLRLNFSGPQAAAMELYDAGLTSTFTQNILIYVVPRVLWPGKPSIASPGLEFHTIISQNANNRTRVGITVFADGYWKMGWFGLALWAAIFGTALGVITRMTLFQLARGQFLYLPAAMLGLQMGATSSGAFLQNATISALPVYFGYCGVVFLFYQFLTRLAQTQVRFDAMASSYIAEVPR